MPIPGARRVSHLEENAAAADIELDADARAAITAALPPSDVVGQRYNDAQLAMVNL